MTRQEFEARLQGSNDWDELHLVASEENLDEVVPYVLDRYDVGDLFRERLSGYGNLDIEDIQGILRGYPTSEEVLDIDGELYDPYDVDFNDYYQRLFDEMEERGRFDDEDEGTAEFYKFEPDDRGLLNFDKSADLLQVLI
jgi:hypothetical protein